MVADASPPLDAASDVSGGGHPRPGDPCTDRSQCDDGVFCNGVEECLGGVCSSPRNAACRDPGGCASAVCDESAGGCTIDPTAGSCTSGVCQVDVGCSAVEGCTRDADCDDARACTDDRCDVASGRCFHTPLDARCPSVGACGDGACVGADVADPSGCDARPNAAHCASTEGCDTSFACIALPTTCTSDAQCTDGSLCDGLERCVDGHCVHGDRTTCVARDACHHSACRTRALGDPYCREVRLPGCP